MTIAWTAFAIAFASSPEPLFLLLTLIMAVSLTVLFIGHIGAFILRKITTGGPTVGSTKVNASAVQLRTGQ